MADTFSLPQLLSDVDDLSRLLGELAEIDLVLDGLQVRGCLQRSAGFVQPVRTLTLGRTEPFDVLYLDTSIADQPGRVGVPGLALLHEVDLGFIAEARAQAETFAMAAKVSLEGLLDPLLLVRPEEFRAIADVLVSLYLALRATVQDDFAGLRNEGADWEGVAADAFFDNFYEPLVKIRANHLWAIDYLTSLTAQLKVTNDLAQHSLANLVGCALEVVRHQLHERRERHRTASTSSTLAFLAAASGILGIITFPAVAGAGAALGSISYMLGYASSQVPPDAGDASITGSSAQEVHECLESNIREVAVKVGDGFDETQQRVQSMRDSIEAMEHGAALGPVSPSRADVWLPRVPDLVAGRDFYHESSGQGR